jgi:hypothetical protein
MSGYLVNSCKVNYPGQGTYDLKAGALVTDPVLVTAVGAAGGILAPGTATILAAVAIIAKLRGSASQGGTGQNEDACDKVMLAAYASDAGFEQGLQKLIVDIPLSLLILQVAATPFNVGPALPANCRLIDSELYVLQKPAGAGPLTAAHAEVGTAAGGVDDLIGLTNIFVTASSSVPLGKLPQGAAGGVGNTGGVIGPITRSGVQLQMNVTEVGSAMSAWTAGHLQMNLYYNIVP